MLQKIRVTRSNKGFLAEYAGSRSPWLLNSRREMQILATADWNFHYCKRTARGKSFATYLYGDRSLPGSSRRIHPQRHDPEKPK
jgi:hypothetical protein